MSGTFLTLSTTTVLVNSIDSSLSSLPLGLMLAVSAISAVFILPKLEAKTSSRVAFSLGPILGIIGAALMIAAVGTTNSLGLIMVASLLLGLPSAVTTKVRFTVITISSPKFRKKALNIVVLGGVFSAVLGPTLSRYTRTAMPVEHMGTYILLLSLYVAMLICTQF